jgi:phage terminase small subunit
MARTKQKRPNPKQLAFVKHYLDGKTVAEAYTLAGYRATGHSAEVAASRLLNNVEIQKLIIDAQKKALDSFEVTPERIVKELARVAFFQKKKMYHPDGSLKTVPEMDDDTAAALASVEVEEAWEVVKGETKPADQDKTPPPKLVRTRTSKVKHCDKLRALELLGKMRTINLWGDETVAPGTGTVNVNVNVVARIDQLTAAFVGAVAREKEGAVPGDGDGEPVDTGGDQARPLPEAG